MQRLLQQDLAILCCYNYDRECVTNLAIFARLGREFSDFWPQKIYSPDYYLIESYFSGQFTRHFVTLMLFNRI